MYPLSQSDYHLLRALQEDLSTSQIDLAERSGLSRSSVWRRIRELEEAGLIEGRVALLNSRLLGFQIHVLVSVSMNKHSVRTRQDFEDHVMTLPEVTECFSVSGDRDYLLHIVARDMETGLQEVIGRLDQQQQLYLESKCDGAEDDPGCQRLAKQIGATYLDMLGIMEERLPDMEHTVNNTRLSLEKRLRSELGNKMTSWTLQETLLGGNPPKDAAAPSPSLRGRSGMRLSERFRQYYKLVASSSSNSDQSLAVLASDIYLDMEETSTLIARTRQEIARATLIEQLNQSFGTITPEMMENALNMLRESDAVFGPTQEGRYYCIGMADDYRIKISVPGGGGMPT